MGSDDHQNAVIGLDIGGTSTTAGLLIDQRITALIRGAGANLQSSGGDLPSQLAEVLGAILAHAGDASVDACVAGATGAGSAGRQNVTELITKACRLAGLRPGKLKILPDPDIAFAAGASTPNGSLLLAGTGAVACQYQDFEPVRRTDGLGWILGDIGGGIWTALEGLRAAVAALDHRGPETSLTSAALEFAADSVTTTGDPRQDLVRLTEQRTPAELGAFARLVAEHARTGDPVAAAITERCAAALLRSLEAVDGTEGPVVLAGSVLTSPGPVRDQVRAQLGARARDAAAPVLGALRLASELAGRPLPDLTQLEVPPTETITKATRNQLVIDHYRPQDRDALYRICLLTGDSGQDASAAYRDPELLGHMYLGAYLELEPHLARVLRRPDGVAVGYCVATSDTSDFERQCEASWWPQLRERYPEPAESDDSRDARLIRRIHHPDHTEGPWLRSHPAHLHIDLLPEAQGSGNGARLLIATLNALTEAGAPGVHLGVGGKNVRAIGFYENMGLRTLKHLSYGLMMGSPLPLRGNY